MWTPRCRYSLSPNLSSVWIVGELYERDFAGGAIGTTVTFAAFPDLQMLGKIAYIDPQVKDSELVRWSEYRKGVVKFLKNSQKEDGSWENPAAVGPMLATPLALIILQLEKGTVPFFAR